MGKHTQGKYYIVSDDDLLDEGQQGKIIIQSEKGYTIAECPFVEEYSEEMQANAAFIVKACNNHEQLLNTIHFAAIDLTNIINGISTKSLYAVHNSLVTALAKVEKG